MDADVTHAYAPCADGTLHTSAIYLLSQPHRPVYTSPHVAVSHNANKRQHENDALQRPLDTAFKASRDAEASLGAALTQA